MAIRGANGKFIKDTDKGLKALVARTAASSGLTLTVGVHGPEGEVPKGETTVADIATVHEYGLGNVPERSFIRGWNDANLDQNKEVLRKIGNAVVKGTLTAEQGLERAGNLFVAGIQAFMVAGIPPPLKIETSDRKGSTTPLIDTGQLKSSIRYIVKRQ